MPNILRYNPKLKMLARKLRNKSTLSEVLLWNKLKNGQVRGYDFHRQKPIDNYIVDFYCPRLKLIIEIDGITHDDQIEKDELRQERLESFGLRFLRFGDYQIKKSLEGVIKEIKGWINENS